LPQWLQTTISRKMRKGNTVRYSGEATLRRLTCFRIGISAFCAKWRGRHVVIAETILQEAYNITHITHLMTCPEVPSSTPAETTKFLQCEQQHNRAKHQVLCVVAYDKPTLLLFCSDYRCSESRTSKMGLVGSPIPRTPDD